MLDHITLNYEDRGFFGELEHRSDVSNMCSDTDRNERKKLIDKAINYVAKHDWCAALFVLGEEDDHNYLSVSKNWKDDETYRDLGIRTVEVQKHYGKTWSADEEEHMTTAQAKRKVYEFCANPDDDRIEKVRDWYLRAYPSDRDAAPRNTWHTVGEIMDMLKRGEDLYDELWFSDSVVRERIFEHVAEVEGIEYNDVYEAWLSNSK